MGVSRICFGTWALGGEEGEQDLAESTAALGKALAPGITSFDSAQAWFARRPNRTLPQLAVALVLAYPAVDCASVGARNSTHFQGDRRYGGWSRSCSHQR